MRNLIGIVLRLQFFGGAVFVGAVSVATIQLPIKIAMTIGIVLLGALQVTTIVFHVAHMEAIRRVLDFVISRSISNDPQSPTREVILRDLGDDFRLGDHSRYWRLLFAIFAFWSVGGAVIYRYFL
jgi:hypothetical protein